MSNCEVDQSSANPLEWDSLSSSMIPLMVHAFSGSRSLVSHLLLLWYTLDNLLTYYDIPGNIYSRIMNVTGLTPLNVSFFFGMLLTRFLL